MRFLSLFSRGGRCYPPQIAFLVTFRRQADKSKRVPWLLWGLIGLLIFLSARLWLKRDSLDRIYRENAPAWERPDRASWAVPLEASLRTLGSLAVGNSSNQASARRPLVALTFDDGPYSLYTPMLLGVLKKYQVPATFFLVGRRVQEFPELTQLIASEGHEIANHTFDHRRERDLSQSELRQDILANEDLLARVCGVRPRLFRPAGGKMSSQGIATVKALGYTTVDYTINPGDWWIHSPEVLLEGLFRGRAREGVVLLHTGNTSTVRVLPLYIEALRAKGFRFVTVSQLIEAVDSPFPAFSRLKPGESLAVKL